MRLSRFVGDVLVVLLLLTPTLGSCVVVFALELLLSVSLVMGRALSSLRLVDWCFY